MGMCLCVCVITGILYIPPVCIVATQLLIKFPATNSRQGSDICITMTIPSPLQVAGITGAPHSLLTFPFFNGLSALSEDVYSASKHATKSSKE